MEGLLQQGRNEKALLKQFWEKHVSVAPITTSKSQAEPFQDQIHTSNPAASSNSLQQAPSRPIILSPFDKHSWMSNIVPEWPTRQTRQGGWAAIPYNGGGWPLLFEDPSATNAEFADFELVCQHLGSNSSIKFTSITSGQNGTAQANIDKSCGGGNIQFYTAMRKLDRPAGNAWICTSSQETAKRYRAILLSSAWFSDAPCRQDF